MEDLVWVIDCGLTLKPWRELDCWVFEEDMLYEFEADVVEFVS